MEADERKIEPALGPVTPDTKTENADFLLEFNSPLTFGKKVPKVLVFSSKSVENKDADTSVDDSGSPQTPKHGVFDPFAPGPEDKVLAPRRKKYFDEASANIARRLDFSYSSKKSCEIEAVPISDEEIFRSVYENLLEVIVSNQNEDALAEVSNTKWNFDACRTPSLIPLLSGVADICPGAPMKQGGRSMAINLRLCRKLEF